MIELYAHPFSSYCWKVMIALYERGLPFRLCMLDQDHPDHLARLAGYWPVGKFPVLVDDGDPVAESSIIIEHLDDDRFGTAGKLIPAEREAAIRVRFLDRVFDNHVMTPTQAVVNEYLIDAAAPDQGRIAKAKASLDTVYDWLDAQLGQREWAAGGDFTLADCAAAPSLFYADWVHPIGDARPQLYAYRARLLARPSVVRVVDGARPYRSFFPLGAPDRD